MTARALIVAFALLAVPAAAEVTGATPGGFTSTHTSLVARPPAQVWDALVQWDHWWPLEHSYSQAHMTLSPVAGGALSESWAGGSVLHATVINAQPSRLLRLSGGFGPLQALPVTAILDVALKPEGAGTRLTLTYRVAGPDLAPMAAPVDGVMGDAFARLTRYAGTGTP
jgi:uncharacterized protein YndB with AHSA1/START domain